MKTIRSLEELSQFRDEIIQQRKHDSRLEKVRLVVGMGSCGIAAGASDVWMAIEQEVRQAGSKNILVSQTGCIGLCKHEPILEVTVHEGTTVTYGHVTPDAVRRILREHVLGGRVVEEFVVDTTPFPTI